MPASPCVLCVYMVAIINVILKLFSDMVINFDSMLIILLCINAGAIKF